MHLLALCVLVQVAGSRSQPPTHPTGGPVVLGPSAITLTGPWRFHTGDDARWATPDFDDNGWEVLDLKAPPGAHDGDVGLSGYVPGWTARGHRGYDGFAWYRTRVVLGGESDSLAIAGPPDVDDAYQVYVNGILVGGVGNFDQHPPTAYSIEPSLFPIPRTPPQRADVVLVVAVRVWMAPESKVGPDAGGIHIAPTIGRAGTIGQLYRIQWIELIRGYFLELLQAGVFVFLAAVAWRLRSLDVGHMGYGWIAAGLTSTAVMRALLAISAWSHWLSARGFDAILTGVVIPCMLGAWALAWSSWARLGKGMPRLIAAAACAYGALGLLASPLLLGVSGAPSVVLLRQLLRLGLLALYAAGMATVAWRGTRDRWLVCASATLIGVGLFAQELSAVGAPSIWFPYGTGVSRTQFAYAGANIGLAILFWKRAGASRPTEGRRIIELHLDRDAVSRTSAEDGG